MGKGGRQGWGDSEAKRDVGIVITFYWKVAAELDDCSERLTVASEEIKKKRQLLCEYDQKRHIILVKQTSKKAEFSLWKIESKCSLFLF